MNIPEILQSFRDFINDPMIKPIIGAVAGAIYDYQTAKELAKNDPNFKWSWKTFWRRVLAGAVIGTAAN